MKITPSDRKYVPALGFHWLTPYYDFVVGAVTQTGMISKQLIQQAQIDTGHHVLDLACGTGTLVILIKQCFPTVNVTGVDCDEKILSIAQRKANQADVTIQFDHAFAEKLPYPDASFDRIVSSLFFHHLTWDNKKSTANEVYRTLKPQGELHVADWGQASSLLMRGLFIPVQLIDGFNNTQDNVSGKLVELFKQAGFAKVVQQQSFNTVFGTMTLYSAVK